MVASKIIDYRALITNLTAGFVGREWVRDAVADFLRADEAHFYEALPLRRPGRHARGVPAAALQGLRDQMLRVLLLTPLGTRHEGLGQTLVAWLMIREAEETAAGRARSPQPEDHPYLLRLVEWALAAAR
jgi:hypothetical protein